jgi:UTP--glucose-1-phosphate uridylyltransferase
MVPMRDLPPGERLFRLEPRFLWAAKTMSDLPPMGAPEVCFAGRSNVGKSSLVNALVGRKGLARASSEPGRTRELIFFAIAGKDEVERIRIVDLPGYGHAVACGRAFTQDESFLLLVGDHVYVSASAVSCARQLVETAVSERSAVSAVQATHESKLPYYGAIGGRRVTGRDALYEIAEVLEKPTPTLAEQRLIIPGLRAAHYLCFFGMHVLTPSLMDLLERQVSETTGPVNLSTALSALARKERYLALETAGRRYDMGAKHGFLTAQLALSLAGRDREEVLAGLVELLAQRCR